MLNIDSTPEFVSTVYENMETNIDVVRKVLNRPLNLIDKVLFSHLDNPHSANAKRGKDYVQLKPDRVVLQDVLGQTGMLQFMQTLKDKVSVPTTIHCDHLIQARTDGDSDLNDSVIENVEVYDFLKTASAKYGVGFWGPGAGIIHQVNLENYAFPGALMIGTDSHTPNCGGLGACAVGVGGADAVEVMAGLPWDLLAPKHIGVKLTGELSGWTAPKDVILYLAGVLTVSGGTNSIIEYFGAGVSSISCTGKATITNMGAELGATTSIFPYDQRMAKYLVATDRGELAKLADRYNHLLTPDDDVEQDPDSFYDLVVEIDLDELEPHLVGPHSPDRARPISQMAAELSENDEFVDQISAALIGSCTNSSYEDMSRAADIANQAVSHGLKAAVPFMVTPGSEQVRATIDRDGQMDSLRNLDATVLANACGPCIGQWKRSQKASEVPNTIVTSYNRNFARRNDGQPTTMNFIASPEIVTALAIAGSLSFNPMKNSLVDENGELFMFDPPSIAPEVPSNGFDKGRSFYQPPPDDSDVLEISISDDSERLQVLKPWPEWDGKDFVEMPILLKASGKTTTDHISPAGPWLRYRGHLDKFSDNMFMGAINAFTGETGKGANVVTEETGISFSRIARSYKANSIRWVVIGDENYGEGSSREHAALSPRLLGAGAVIARSFARIHETNLKKQGLLALTFSDPLDYDLIQETDRISILDLNNISSGTAVKCLVVHTDGSSVELKLNHTYVSDQLEWFRAGSALNLFHK
jgi:aconitate hydratase